MRAKPRTLSSVGVEFLLTCMPLAEKSASLVRFSVTLTTPELHSRIDTDTDLQNIMEIRANAYRSCIDFEHDSHLRRAMLRTGRPWKGPWEVGMRVAYWKHDRAEKMATGRKARPGYALGVIINVDNSRMNGIVWVRSDNNMIVEVP